MSEREQKEEGLRAALAIVQSKEFNTGDAEADYRTIEIEAALIREMLRLGIDVEIPKYIEGLA